jgi:DNA repair exonuclease SbcCD ATPase subunit
MCVLNADLDAADARVEQLKQALEQAIAERTPHDYGVLKEEAQEMRKQRDEAFAEVEERKSALIDATYQIDNYKSKFLLWFENAKTQNTKLLDALEDATKARKELEQLKQALHDARLENSGQAARIEELKRHIGEVTEMVRPEPSRLEIAAMVAPAICHLGCGMDLEVNDFLAACVQVADALIAAAKKGK